MPLGLACFQMEFPLAIALFIMVVTGFRAHANDRSPVPSMVDLFDFFGLGAWAMAIFYLLCTDPVAPGRPAGIICAAFALSLLITYRRFQLGGRRMVEAHVFAHFCGAVGTTLILLRSNQRSY